MDGDWKRSAAENPEVAARQESEWERDAETPGQQQTRLAKQNERRHRETQEQREARLAAGRAYRQAQKAAETPEEVVDGVGAGGGGGDGDALGLVGVVEGSGGFWRDSRGIRGDCREFADFAESWWRNAVFLDLCLCGGSESGMMAFVWYCGAGAGVGALSRRGGAGGLSVSKNLARVAKATELVLPDWRCCGMVPVLFIERNLRRWRR